jgi:RNA polymerase sigma-70 factor (ECF subfamily)
VHVPGLEETMTGPTADGSAPLVPSEEQELLGALRRGDGAFARLVETLHGSMLRLAMIHLGDRAVAEEVVQDAWLGVLQQLDRFEGRSSLKTWVLRIVSNRAKTRAVRERRTVPFSALAGGDLGADEPAVDPDRFLPAGHRWAGTGPPRRPAGARSPRTGCCRGRPSPRWSGPWPPCRWPSGPCWSSGTWRA